MIQLTLNSIMSHKFTRYAQVVQSFLVPISAVAFFLAARTLPLADGFLPAQITQWDVAGLAIVALGVFLHNIFREHEVRYSV